MCGIYGTTLRYNEYQVKDKLKRTSFRGPDQMGWQFYRRDNCEVILGHNRLSIIDLDSRSNQPFTYYNDIHIVFNGEIYNFINLKQALLKKGYQFKTTSDTEVICASYLEYGENCVEYFNGMFAFVIYDAKKQLFFGARDRLGQKPFYFYHKGKDFEFSSQISSIQSHNPNLSISKNAIAYYLAWGNIPDSQSIFNEVKKLLPGTSFTFNLLSGEFNTKNYWNIDFKGKTNFKGSYKEAISKLTSILEDAVSIRLFADVPVGIFLSGGIDSSLVSAIASVSHTKVKTFSIKFNEKGFDESNYAQKVADHLKTDHHVIECSYIEGMELIENFHHYYDEPFADSSAIPSMLLAKHTKNKVTVALSGDGGDESFIGYQRYDWIKKGQLIYHLPYFMRNMGSKVLDHSGNYRHKVISKALKYKTVNDAYLASMTGIDLSWIDSEIDYRNVEELKYLYHTDKNLYERVSDFDIKTYLNWDINTKVDRATMAYSLEARSPLMDYRIVDFARSLPTSFKYHNGNKKRILKDILYNYVPKDIFNRPKAGFTMPFSEWFRGDLKNYVLTELNEDTLKSLPCIDSKKVLFMINQHMNGSWNRYPLIWSLLVLKQWLNTNGKSISIR